MVCWRRRARSVPNGPRLRRGLRRPARSGGRRRIIVYGFTISWVRFAASSRTRGEPLQVRRGDRIDARIVVLRVVDRQAVQHVEAGLDGAGRIGLEAHAARRLQPGLAAAQLIALHAARLDPRDLGAQSRPARRPDAPGWCRRRSRTWPSAARSPVPAHKIGQSFFVPHPFEQAGRHAAEQLVRHLGHIKVGREQSGTGKA